MVKFSLSFRKGKKDGGFERLIYLLDLIILMIYPVTHCSYCEMTENAQDFPHVNNKTHPERPTGSSA